MIVECSRATLTTATSATVITTPIAPVKRRSKVRSKGRPYKKSGQPVGQVSATAITPVYKKSGRPK